MPSIKKWTNGDIFSFILAEDALILLLNHLL